MEYLSETEFKQKIVDKLIQNKIFGSTNIAKYTIKNLIGYIKLYGTNYTKKVKSFKNEINNFTSELNIYLEYEPLAKNAVKFVTRELDDYRDINEITLGMSHKTREFFNYVDEAYEIIRRNSITFLKGYSKFITLSDSSMVGNTITSMKERISVIVLESRPRLTGRLFANSIIKENILVYIALDNLLGSMFNDENFVRPDCAIVGAESITVDGSLIAKNGTYSLAIHAYDSEIPFFVLSQSMKIDISRTTNSSFKPICFADEYIWKSKPEEIEIISSSLEAIPAKYITGGYITERGLLRPEEIKDLL